MLILELTDKRANRLIKLANKDEGTFLSTVYEHYSTDKIEKFYYLYDEYINTPGAENFHICSHSNIGFTVAWYTPFGIRIVTPYNSYFILMT